MGEDPAAHAGDPRVWETLEADELRGFLVNAAKLWLAHDGLWFQAVERRLGLEAAIDCDADAWHRFSPLEARRILDRLGLEPGGGLPLLERALRHRLYSHLNEQRIEWPAPDRLRLRMLRCRVQAARDRRGLPAFPCKRVGIVEYTRFAEAIDPRIATTCLCCPPDPRAAEHVCAWEFTLPEEREM